MLEMIDRLAGWWLDWRMRQAVANHPELKRFGIERFEGHEGGFDLVMTTPVAAILADGLAEFLQENNAENYIQFDVMPRLDRGLPPVRVTVQWANGMSPAQKAAMLEERIEELEEGNHERYKRAKATAD